MSFHGSQNRRTEHQSSLSTSLGEPCEVACFSHCFLFIAFSNSTNTKVKNNCTTTSTLLWPPHKLDILPRKHQLLTSLATCSVGVDLKFLDFVLRMPPRAAAQDTQMCMQMCMQLKDCMHIRVFVHARACNPCMQFTWLRKTRE